MALGSGSSDAIRALIARQRAVLAAEPCASSAPGTSARLDESARACRTAIRLLEGRADAEALRARRDPLSESTQRALARLRGHASRPAPR